MKCEASQELVVGGFTDPQGTRAGLGALLVGYFEGDDFVFAGKVGTGLDTRLLLDLRARLNALEIPTSPFTKATGLPRVRVHWVRPEDRRAGGLHRMDRQRQAAALTPARHSHGQVRPGSREGAAVITHPEKVLFPDDGITKGELAAYYEAIAPAMVPHIRQRPVTMERFPAGIDKEGFLQKDVSKGYPAWLQRVEVPKKGGTVHHPLVTDTRSLLWLANQNSITPHVWTSRAPDLYQPDICVFDLDPSEDAPGHPARRGAWPARPACGARPAKLGEDIRLEGLPHRRAARREGRLRRRGRLLARGGPACWSRAIPST